MAHRRVGITFNSSTSSFSRQNRPQWHNTFGRKWHSNPLLRKTGTPRYLGQHFYLAPNHQDGSLVNLQNFVSIQADFATSLQTTRMNFMEQKQDPFYKLLDHYQDLSTPSFKPKHGICYYIPTECRPIQSRAQKPAPTS